MKKLIALIIILVLAVTFVFAQSRPDGREKSIRQRLEDVEGRLNTAEQRLSKIEEKLYPDRKSKEQKQEPVKSSHIQLPLEVGQIIYFDHNQDFKVNQVIDKQNLIAEVRIDFRNRYGESVNAAYTRGGPYEAISRLIWIRGLDTSNYVDDTIIKPSSSQLFKITGTEIYDTTDGGTKTVFLFEPYSLSGQK